MNYIPKFRMNVNQIVEKAETNGCYCIESESKRRMVYMADSERVVILRGNSVLVIPIDEVETLVEELPEVIADIAEMIGSERVLPNHGKAKELEKKKPEVLKMLKQHKTYAVISKELGISKSLIGKFKQEFERKGIL